MVGDWPSSGKVKSKSVSLNEETDPSARAIKPWAWAAQQIGLGPILLILGLTAYLPVVIFYSSVFRKGCDTWCECFRWGILWSCLLRNIRHFNQQSHVTGPVSFILVFRKNKTNLAYTWKRSHCLSVCADASCSSAIRRHVGSPQREAGSRSHCLHTMIMWCDLKRKTFVSFHDVRWIRISITTQHNNIHVIIKRLLETFLDFSWPV